MSLLGKSAPKTVVGLDIGSSLIKVAEARVGKNTINLTGLGVAPVPEGTIENGIIVDPQGLGHAVKQLLSESGIKAKTVVSSLSGQSSLVVRVIEMPKMTPKELGEAMKFEVERQTPFAPSEVVMDFAPVEKPSTPPDAQQMEVLLAAAQQDVVNNHVEVLFSAGLKPYAIDIEPLAASRALIDASSNGVKNATVGVVNIGASKTDVGIFEGGILTSPIPPLQIAGINITRSISEALGETLESAEILKKQFAEIDMSRIDEISSGMGSMGFGMGQDDGNADYSSPINFIGNDSGGFDPSNFVNQEPAAPAAGESTYASPFGFTQPEPEPDEPISPFKNTVDGPVFDLDGDDTGVTPAKPAFDLSDDIDVPDTAPPAAPSTGPTFDLNDEPAAPSAPASEPTAFRFDLNDETESPVFGGAPEGTGEPKPVGGSSIPSGTGEPRPVSNSMFDFEDSGTGDPTPAASPFNLSGTGEPRPINPEDDFSGVGEPTQMGAVPEPEDNYTTGGFAAVGTDHERKKQIFEAIAPVISDLAAELRRSIEYYKTRFQNQPEKIFITGGSAKIKNLDKYLTHELGIPVEVADPISNLTVTSARFSEQYLSEVSPLFTVSVGLAIREML